MADTKISALTGATTPLAGTEVLPIVQSGTTKKVSVANLTAGRQVEATSFLAQGVATQTAGVAGLYVDYTPGTFTTKIEAINPGNAYLPLQISAGTQYLQTNGIDRVTLASGGDVTVNTGNLVIGTSGKGIDFSATPGTGTSELLADYEEGLYTATLTPSTSGTITVSSSNDQLAYTKIGRVVYVQGFISTSGVSAPVGGAVYLNLPFAPATLSEGAGFSTGAFIFADAPSYALTNYGCIVSPSGNRNELLINASLVGNGDEFQIGFNYIAA